MKKKKAKDNRTFAERHPRWNLFFGIILFLLLAGLSGFVLFETLYYLGVGISKLLVWIESISSKMDAVVIVALITGAVSIIGIILSSIVAKGLEYKRNRREYLTQKREQPYADFIEMIYKLQQSTKKEHEYSHEDMIKDLTSFSKQITLWGSPKVVNNWVKFRENALKNDGGMENLLLTEEIMNAMRKDLGLKKVKRGNLLAFFVNDIKQAMKNMKR